MTNGIFESGLLLDIVIILIFAINGALGFKRGLIDSLYRGLRLIAAAAVAFVLSTPLAGIVAKTKVYEGILSQLEEKLLGYFSDIAANAVGSASFELPEKLTKLLSFLGFSAEEITDEYARLVAEQSVNAAEGIARYIVTPVCDALLKALCFAALFLAAALAFRIVMKLLNLIAKAPLLNGANKFLGLVCGLLIAVIHTVIFCMLFDAILPYLTAIDAKITIDCIDSSNLYRFFDAFNPFA